MTTLEIKDLHVSVENPNAAEGEREIAILNGVDLTVKSGETHALMGPNGSGKSTLSYAIAGHPKYQVTSGSITLDGEDVLAMSVDERARAGIFLAMQYPVEVPGVSVSNFLRSAATAIRGEAPKLRHWVKEVKGAMTSLEIDPAFAERSVNEGFSGGEKKRHEILQLELLKPKIAILDETDSGLDVDALRVVSDGVNRYAESEHGRLRYPAGPHGDPCRFPHPEARHAGRKSVGVPGFRRDVAAAAAGPRCRAGLRAHLQRRGASRCAPADGGGDRRLRAGTCRYRCVRRHRNRTSRRVGVHQERHRVAQPGVIR